MEEKNDFDKLFGSNLPNFADKDWRNLEGKLERHDLKKQFTRLLWALHALGGILMAISGILYYQLNQTRQQVRSLENRLVSVYEHKKAEPEISPQKIIIHDTIYKQIVIRQTIREIQTENQNLANNSNNIYYEKYGDNFTENQVVTEREKYIGINKLLGKNPILNSSNIAVDTDLSKYKVIEFPEDSLEENNHFSLIPKSISVGILGGIQKPIGDDFEHSGGNDFGLRTVLGYNNSKGQERWGVVLDFQQSNLFFDNNKRDRFDKFGSPSDQKPIGQKPDLSRVDVTMYSSYKVGAGLRYNFLFSEKIKPYIGAGWAIQIPNKYNIDYHFSNQPTQTDTRKQESINHLWGISTGVNILLSSHLALNGEAYYQSQLSNNTNPLESQPVLGGRVGVSYRFGK
jgi:opacity protein-like surface antigen